MPMSFADRPHRLRTTSRPNAKRALLRIQRELSVLIDNAPNLRGAGIEMQITEGGIREEVKTVLAKLAYEFYDVLLTDTTETNGDRTS